jgi:hypothetical protein
MIERQTRLLNAERKWVTTKYNKDLEFLRMHHEIALKKIDLTLKKCIGEDYVGEAHAAAISAGAGGLEQESPVVVLDDIVDDIAVVASNETLLKELRASILVVAKNMRDSIAIHEMVPSLKTLKAAKHHSPEIDTAQSGSFSKRFKS